MKILLIWPKSNSDIENRQALFPITEPLALEYLASVGLEKGHEVEILDLRIYPDSLLDTVQRFQPDIVGITAYSMHVVNAIETSKIVNKLCSEAIVIIGGHHATIHPEDFFVNSFNYIVVGEGVKPFSELIDSILKVTKKQLLFNNVWSKIGKEFVYGDFGSKTSLDKLPHPNRTLTKKDRHRYYIDWMQPVALLRTSLGCPYRCTFCSLWKIEDGYYHVRNADSVVEELKEIKEPYVFLIDDEAFINRKRMIELASKIKQSKINKKYFAYCRIDTLIKNDEALRAWKEIGLERIFVGIDSVSPKGLDLYNKKYNVASIENGLNLANEIGLKVFSQFVVDTDWEHKDFLQLSRFIKRNDIEYPSFTVLTPLPGTDLLPDFSKITELQENGRPDWSLFDTDHPVVKTKLPKEEFVALYEGLWQKFYREAI